MLFTCGIIVSVEKWKNGALRTRTYRGKRQFIATKDAFPQLWDMDSEGVVAVG